VIGLFGLEMSLDIAVVVAVAVADLLDADSGDETSEELHMDSLSEVDFDDDPANQQVIGTQMSYARYYCVSYS
jgi:hypothetical protein